MEYVNRTYRNHFRQDRWNYFPVRYKETDLWIGIDKASWQSDIVPFAEKTVQELRTEMDVWIEKHPDYAKALGPCPAAPDAPVIFHEMAMVARQSGIGPMSAVAGAVAKKVGQTLKTRFHIQEILIENGGDIYADIQEDINISVFAGTSPLSEKIGLHIEAAYAPLGICTSSGTVGPSLSFGKADAVMIICRDTALADTYATAFANRIQTSEDIDPCLEKIKKEKDIIAAMIVKGDKMGITGQFDLKIF